MLLQTNRPTVIIYGGYNGNHFLNDVSYLHLSTHYPLPLNKLNESVADFERPPSLLTIALDFVCKTFKNDAVALSRLPEDLRERIIHGAGRGDVKHSS